MVGSPFGLKGFVKVKSLSGETNHFHKLKKITLRKGGKEEVREVAEIQEQGNEQLLMRFKGIEDPEAAKSLNGAEIIAEREFAAPLKNGEYYIEDLKGLKIVAADGAILGNIIDIIEGGGGFLAELKLLSGDLRLVPFRREFLGEIDQVSGKVELLEPWILE
ncbi:MAG: ribosome maturation factor RimM [Treponema sp.]|nr:ribosome maturation factor RimM [Treponema sp.]